MTADSIKLSVAICAHNPRAEYLSATLEGLRKQTLVTSQWELLIIDNASNPPLLDRVDLSWHPNARIILENTLGLTPARICAFKSCKTDLLLMVDDDNVLEDHFLERTLEIAEINPNLGAWGASIDGDFENPVPKWLERELLYLAVRPIEAPEIAQSKSSDFLTPAGAGLTVRRQIFEHYITLIENDSTRKNLDRKGKSLVSSGDTDLAMCAWDNGLGLANFPQLKITHLIPKERMSFDYMRRLHFSMAYSGFMLTKVRGGDPKKRIPSRMRVFKTVIRDALKGNWIPLRFFLEQQKGYRKAVKDFCK